MSESIVTPVARAKFVVTLPQKPSFIADELHKLAGSSYTTFTSTSDAFVHLARKAKQRLVVMTPFIDKTGSNWASEIFQISPASEKILILRDSATLNNCGIEGEKLKKLATKIYDYTLSRIENGEEYEETFHAKIVLADGVAAYVGSANFLFRSKEVNLECGFILDGEAVAPVAVLIDAVLSIFDSKNSP
jgi:phosphatidylserine/phosphatidylglycerophosphate/cardiolipin synthase-like enzyme